MYDADKYEKVASHESSGPPRTGLGVQIFVTKFFVNSELAEEEATLVRKYCSELHEKLLFLRQKNDGAAIIAGEDEVKALTNCFKGPIFVERIPSCCANRPWLIVTTKIGRIKIGWRKSVIQIDWSDSTVNDFADELFPDEDVTKSGRVIHAWSLEDAVKYLKVIQKAK